MANRQFMFSVSVGVLLIVAGALLSTQASIGISLMAVGAAIGVLALIGRNSDARVVSIRARDRAVKPGHATDY